MAKSDDFPELAANLERWLSGLRPDREAASLRTLLEGKMLELEQRNALHLLEPGRLTVRAFCACCALEAMQTAVRGKQSLTLGRDVLLASDIIRYEELAARLTVIEERPITLSLADMVMGPSGVNHRAPWYRVMCEVQGAVLTAMLRRVEVPVIDRFLTEKAMCPVGGAKSVSPFA